MKIKKFIKKNRLWLFPILCTLLAVILCITYLATGEPDAGVNPVRNVNENRSQIYVTGKDYSLNYQQEQEHIKESGEKEQQIKKENKNEIQDQIETHLLNKERDKKTNKTVTNKDKNYKTKSGGNTISDVKSPEKNQGGSNRDEQIPSEDSNNEKTEEPAQSVDESDKKEEGEELPGGSDGEEEGEDGSGENTGGQEEESKKPLIECSLKNGQEISGAFFNFTVRATDYQKNPLSAFYIHVYLNGNVLTSSGTSGNRVSYIVDSDNPPEDGNNEILVKVTDKEGNTASKSYTVVVDAQGDREKGGEVTITIEARTLGLGTLLHKTVDFYEGETIPYVLDRVILDGGYQYERDKSLRQGFYLKSINKPGITKGWSIPEPILEKLEEENSSKMDHENDRLAEKHFYENSGWMYMYNGVIVESGMSAVKVEDGDEITIFYTLDLGKEYNGKWFSGNW